MSSKIKTQHTNKLFFGKFSSKAVLDCAMILHSLNSYSTEESLTQNGSYGLNRWQNLITPFRLALASDTLPDKFSPYVAEHLVKQIKNQCVDLSLWYRKVVLVDKRIERAIWAVDPSYIGKTQNEAAVTFRIHLYFKDNSGAREFVDSMDQQQLDIFKDVTVTNIHHQAVNLINGDPRIVALKKYPYGKYTGKIWLNCHRLGKLPDEKKTQILNVLESYEESGLLRCQPLLRSFLSGDRKYLWTDPYFYTLSDDIKNVLDLVLVNIVSKQERIVLYG